MLWISTSRRNGLTTYSSAPAAWPAFASSRLTYAAVIITTGTCAVAGAALIRRHTS